MIGFKRFTLDNGLRVIVHEDHSTPLAAVNVLYNVGARDELPEKTGFAHLFEHLMFGGSENVPDFDVPIQTAGGDCNAFTNSDITNYYDTVPAENLETVLWLEADRMAALNINARSLEVQRKVVVEEFNETCLNTPYGDAWHRLSGMAYQQHPYRWPTIGLVPEHIAEANLEDVRDFHKKYYCPNNAILVVAGKVGADRVKELTERWFGSIPKQDTPPRQLPKEPPQTAARRSVHQADVPLDALYMVFHIPARSHPDYHATDLLSDILANGKSSRLFKSVKKKLQLFVDVDAYITGSIDPGLLVLEGRLSENITVEQAEAGIWVELEKLKQDGILHAELQKYQNKAISSLIFEESNLLNRAMKLALFECIGDAALINGEEAAYRAINPDDIQRVARQILTKENCSVLVYNKQQGEL